MASVLLKTVFLDLATSDKLITTLQCTTNYDDDSDSGVEICQEDTKEGDGTSVIEVSLPLRVT